MQGTEKCHSNRTSKRNLYIMLLDEEKKELKINFIHDFDKQMKMKVLNVKTCYFRSCYHMLADKKKVYLTTKISLAGLCDVKKSRFFFVSRFLFSHCLFRNTYIISRLA